jgi:hypothetical protein
MGEQKPKMADSIRKIRHVFMHEWDPIGVGEMDDWPEDEYDAYVAPMYSLLRQQKGEAAISAYLAKVYEQIMGSRLPAEKFAGPARKFLQIDVSQDEIHHTSNQALERTAARRMFTF